MHTKAPQFAAVVFAAALVTACATDSAVSFDADASRAQLFEGTGAHRRDITTSSPEAQHYFDQGLAWMYAFNHDEAIRSFARAAEIDPDCAMAWWGIAVCEGPNYNDPVMTPERTAGAWRALQEARARIANASPLERDLIEALSARYAKAEPADRSHLDGAYADAMADVWARHPDDSDVGTLFAEAMMVRRPWMLYSADGAPEGDTPLIVATLERVMELEPGNPGANHLFIHAVEPSRDPSRGIAAADRLCAQVPVAGHLRHMPSHIYVQVGMWDASVRQNAYAMRADAAYLERSPDQTVQYVYIVHNAHMLAFSAMMVGREREAMDAARSMWRTMPPEMLPFVAPYIDPWMTSVYDVQKRFGRWDALLAEPAPPECLPITTAVWRAHRAIAYAAKHDFPAAVAEYEAFRDARDAVPEESVFGTDSARRILAVSDAFVAGELSLQRGDYRDAARTLTVAVEAEDSLSYGEPPVWLQPTRHTLGAVYLADGRYADAARVYREDLERWPENGWSLFGLARALRGLGRADEADAVQRRYEAAWSKADAPTETSCKCIPRT